MTEYATKKPNREETENKENICSICGKAGAERRILPSAQAIEYAVKGKKDTITQKEIISIIKCIKYKITKCSSNS